MGCDFDVVSLGASIVEVIATPGDSWAWVGLAGDIVDLIPGVTGVGELAKSAKVAKTVVSNADNVVDASKLMRVADNVPDALKKATGTHEIIFENGYNYVGKGPLSRAIQSATAHSKGTS